MSTHQHQPDANFGFTFGILSEEQDDSWVAVGAREYDSVMSTNGSFCFPELEQPNVMNAPELPSNGPLFFGNMMDWELSTLEHGFDSMETPIDFSSFNFETTLAEEGIFNCSPALLLELNDLDFASVISDGSSWEIPISSPPASLSPRLSLASSQDDLLARPTTPIDNFVPPEGPGISPIPSNERPTPSRTKVCAHAPRPSVRERELATHNIRVNSRELQDKLTERGHIDKIEALDVLLGRIDEFIAFRQIYGHDRDTRSSISPPEALGATYFAPFLKKRHKGDGSNKRTLFYTCLFCGHELANRTQMVQHLMARHFRYFPHECYECDATFCRRADLMKHGKDKHSGMSVLCRCGKTFSNQRNHQRHQRKRDCCSD